MPDEILLSQITSTFFQLYFRIRIIELSNDIQCSLFINDIQWYLVIILAMFLSISWACLFQASLTVSYFPNSSTFMADAWGNRHRIYIDSADIPTYKPQFKLWGNYELKVYCALGGYASTTPRNIPQYESHCDYWLSKMSPPKGTLMGRQRAWWTQKLMDLPSTDMVFIKSFFSRIFSWI